LFSKRTKPRKSLLRDHKPHIDFGSDFV